MQSRNPRKPVVFKIGGIPLSSLPIPVLEQNLADLTTHPERFKVTKATYAGTNEHFFNKLKGALTEEIAKRKARLDTLLPIRSIENPAVPEDCIVSLTDEEFASALQIPFR